MKVTEYLNYAKAMNANAEVLAWIELILGSAEKKNKLPSQVDVEHIIDFLCSDKAPKRLMKMSISQAKQSAEAWAKTNQKKGKNLIEDDDDTDTIHSYSDGSRIAKLVSEKAYKREGFLMSHCLGGYTIKNDVEIYSYRDNKNQPHATFEVRRQGGEINQIKGKGNGPIHPRYIMSILDFLTSIGQKPRPSEMINLGYHHIAKEHLEYIKNVNGWEKQVTTIHGELYAY